MTGPRFGAITCGPIAIRALALLGAGGGLALLAAATWPFASWSILVFAAWIAFPAWVFHATAPLALPRRGLGPAFATLAPLALVGGVGLLGHAAWRQHDAPLPLAFLIVPAMQLAVVLPFLLFTGTDKSPDAVETQES